MIKDNVSSVIPMTIEKRTKVNSLTFEPMRGGMILPRIVDPLYRKQLKEIKLDSIEWEYSNRVGI